MKKQSPVKKQSHTARISSEEAISVKKQSHTTRISSEEAISVKKQSHTARISSEEAISREEAIAYDENFKRILRRIILL